MDKAQVDLINLTKELIQLTKENNQMLIKISAYIDKVQSAEYQITEEQKNLLTNLIANMLVGFRRY
jgi:hypothetical protein